MVRDPFSKGLATMLEKIANRFQTAMLIALVFLLCAVFVLQFGGPQAEGCTGGGGVYAAKIHGRTISDGDFRAAYILSGFHRRPIEQQRVQDARQLVMDGLVERSLLAEEARELGFEVTADDVMDRLVSDGTVYLSLGVDAPSYLPSGEVPVDLKDSDGKFDMEQARRFIQNYLRRSFGEFTEMQVEETLAQRMRELLVSNVEVSPREVWDAFVQEKDKARVKFIRFSPAYFRDRMDTSDAAIRTWMTENEEAVDREYQANKHRYTDLEEQVRARHILIKVDAEADEAAKQAKHDEAAALLRRVRAGEDFAELAREHSEDTGSAVKGGDLGWNPRGRMVRPFDEAQFSLEPGKVSDLVESTFGFHIIKVEGKREGDVPEDEAKRELAERLYRDARAGELAKEAAENALAELKSGVSLEVLDRRLAGKPDEEPEPAEGEEEDEGEDPPRDALAPQVRETRDFGRADNPVLGLDSGPLAKAAFERTLEDPLPEEPIQLGQEYVVFQLVGRTEANAEDLTDEVRERLRRGLLRTKEQEVLRQHLGRLRTRANNEGAIQINPEVLLYGDETEEDDAENEEEES